MSEPILRRTPEDREQLTRALEELRQAEERLRELRRHGWYLPDAQALEARVAELREQIARMRRGRAA